MAVERNCTVMQWPCPVGFREKCNMPDRRGRPLKNTWPMWAVFRWYGIGALVAMVILWLSTHLLWK
jgi:hypothetical protein